MPDRDEIVLDELATKGDIPTNWRIRQARLRQLLRSLPGTTEPVGPSIGSAAIIADRDETDR